MKRSVVFDSRDFSRVWLIEAGEVEVNVLADSMLALQDRLLGQFFGQPPDPVFLGDEC